MRGFADFDQSSALEDKDLSLQVAVQRRPLTATSFVDNNQIVEGRDAVKLGPVLVRESPAPVLCPHPPKMPDEVGVVISAIDYGVQWARNNL